ncbi:MAG: hypothetical protein AAGA50_07665 [Pseudomonadota bacterium]
MQNPDLWNRICSAHPDTLEADFPFSARLARENGWTHDFALQVIEEYLRFAYLSQISPSVVTPSEDVDQAWHLHLTFTKHYWVPFREALGGALHHMPTTGGAGQAAFFRDAYDKTLALYVQEFGTPPEDVWPSADIRFSKGPRYRRVNANGVWVIPKPKIPGALSNACGNLWKVRKFVCGAALAMASVLFGSRIAFAHGETSGDGILEKFFNMLVHWITGHSTEMLVIIVVISLVLFAIVGEWNNRKRSRSSKGSSSKYGGCSSSSGDSGDSSGCSSCGGGGD